MITEIKIKLFGDEIKEIIRQHLIDTHLITGAEGSAVTFTARCVDFDSNSLQATVTQYREAKEK